MRSLEMSLVFKLSSIEDLSMLTAALKQVKTLQEMVKLENDVRQLKGQKNILQDELREIKGEIHTLCPEKLIKSDEKDVEKMDVEPENTEDLVETVEEDTTENRATVELERPAFAHEEAAPSLIEERTDGAQQEEEETIV